MTSSRAGTKVKGVPFVMALTCMHAQACRGIIERNIAEVAAGRQAKQAVLEDAVQHFRADYITATAKQGAWLACGHTRWRWDRQGCVGVGAVGEGLPRDEPRLLLGLPSSAQEASG